MDSSLVRREGRRGVILQAKPGGLCARAVWGMFILTPHWCSHCWVQIEQWRWNPRFTGHARSFTSLGPLGPIPCLDLACKENSRPSQPDSEVEPSKHTCRTETGGNKECKTVREAWREATKPAAALGGQFFILTEMKLEGWVHGETESWLLYLCEVISVGSFYDDACKQTVADLIWTFYWTGVHIQLTVV